MEYGTRAMWFVGSKLPQGAITCLAHLSHMLALLSHGSENGFRDELEAVRTTDYDHCSRQIADGFVREDKFILKTGRPILNQMRLWYNAQRLLDWFISPSGPGSVFESCNTGHFPRRDRDEPPLRSEN